MQDQQFKNNAWLQVSQYSAFTSQIPTCFMTCTTQGCYRCWFSPLDKLYVKTHQDFFILLLYMLTQSKGQSNIDLSDIRCVCRWFVPQKYCKCPTLACLPSWPVTQQNQVLKKARTSSNACEALKGAGPFRRNADNVLKEWCHFYQRPKRRGKWDSDWTLSVTSCHCRCNMKRDKECGQDWVSSQV